jgi:hypothetical protein
MRAVRARSVMTLTVAFVVVGGVGARARGVARAWRAQRVGDQRGGGRAYRQRERPAE